MDGLFGLALSPKKSPDNSNNVVFGIYNKRQSERSLFFHSLASGSENFVPLRIVNNATLWETGSANTAPREFQQIGMRGIQTAGNILQLILKWKSFDDFFFQQLKLWIEMGIYFLLLWIRLHLFAGTLQCLTWQKISKLLCRMIWLCNLLAA